RAGEAVESVAATQLGVGEAPGRGAELGEAAAPVADGGLVVGAEVEACEELPALSLEFGDLPFAVGQATSGVGGVVACLLVCAGSLLQLRDGGGEVFDGGEVAITGGHAGDVLGPRVNDSRCGRAGHAGGRRRPHTVRRDPLPRLGERGIEL